MKKLKIDNIIKTALLIYRNRFREYYCLAFTNSFWIFVPLYGWAKYAATMGLLARLAYGDVRGNSETITEAKRYIRPKIWSFFGAGLIETIVFYSKIFLFVIPLRIAIAIIFYTGSFNFLFNVSFWLIITVFSFCYYYWVMSRLFLYELPLATDSKINATESRKIAWQLVRKLELKVSIIIFSFSCIFVISSLITRAFNNTIYSEFNFSSIGNLFDFSYINLFAFLSATLFFCGALFIPVLSSAISILFRVIFSYLSLSNANYTLFISKLSTLVILQIVVGALFIPLWQSLKAVTYHRLTLVSDTSNATYE